jgi:uncharacterized ion transporter superfamily protein YfcC
MFKKKEDIMSKSGSKAKAKIQRKEKAIRKARQKTILIVSIIALIITAVIAVGVYSASRQNNAEIYSTGGQTVQLFADGNFSARLAHNTLKNGTYTKREDGSNTIVSFNVDGRVELGRIENNRLFIPEEWDDGHGHGNVLRKR